MIGVFHNYRKHAARDRIVFDGYKSWRAPDGEIAISPLREELLAALPAEERVVDAAAHDSEHSIESLAYWLKHARPDVEIVPIIIPAIAFPRMQSIAAHLGKALAATMKKRHLVLGKDLAIVLSTDGTHYGPDFNDVPWGDGGIEPYQKALERDRLILKGPLSGPVSPDKARAFYSAATNPDNLDEYRNSWCGRFSIPFGLLLIAETAKALALKPLVGVPVAMSASVGVPELKIRDLGLGPTAPANLYHFVVHPAVAFVAGK
jgi:AmmeMemoRadiSam system protein B